MPRESDFEARWTEGAWAELQVIQALNAEPTLFAVQFGITDGTAFWSIRDMEARALPDQNQHGKRPDVLVFHRANLSAAELAIVDQLVLQDDATAEPLTRKAILALECEFSPYNYSHRLANYGKELSFTINDEDLQPLVTWHSHFEVSLGIVQVYLDSAYFLSFKTLTHGISSGAIRRQIERAYNKAVYYPKMSEGIAFAKFDEMPDIGGGVKLDKYGKYNDSALQQTFPTRQIREATGIEIDPHYGDPARKLWEGTKLHYQLGDFTAHDADPRFNLLVCNPPYVRHHHMPNDYKASLQFRTQQACGVKIAGLAGLYCYFLGLSHPWLAPGAISAWLIPSEFMDVNYGRP